MPLDRRHLGTTRSGVTKVGVTRCDRRHLGTTRSGVTKVGVTRCDRRHLGTTRSGVAKVVSPGAVTHDVTLFFYLKT